MVSSGGVRELGYFCVPGRDEKGLAHLAIRAAAGDHGGGGVQQRLVGGATLVRSRGGGASDDGARERARSRNRGGFRLVLVYGSMGVARRSEGEAAIVGPTCP